MSEILSNGKSDLVLEQFTKTTEFEESLEVVESACIEAFNQLSHLSVNKREELLTIKDDKNKLMEHANQLLSSATKASISKAGEALRIAMNRNNIQESELKSFISSSFPQTLYVEIQDENLNAFFKSDPCLKRLIMARELIGLGLLIGIYSNLRNPFGLAEVLAAAIEADLVAMQEAELCMGSANSFISAEGTNIMEDMELVKRPKEDSKEIGVQKPIGGGDGTQIQKPIEEGTIGKIEGDTLDLTAKDNGTIITVEP